jgi:hypothetical protein
MQVVAKLLFASKTHRPATVATLSYWEKALQLHVMSKRHCSCRGNDNLAAVFPSPYDFQVLGSFSCFIACEAQMNFVVVRFLSSFSIIRKTILLLLHSFDGLPNLYKSKLR